MVEKPIFSEQMNTYARDGIAFLFVLDFDLKNTLVIPAHEISPEIILFNINNHRNTENRKGFTKNIISDFYPPAYDGYVEKFEEIQKEILYGNTYLLNLSFKSEVELTSSLEEIFYSSTAPYKLYLKDHFVVNSPESFIRISGRKIYTYPMKGTMVKENESSRDLLLGDIKESAEHATITDLLRNDLAIVASDVKVDRYRYIDEINTGRQTILQVSSEISGNILDEFDNKPGDIFARLLPAGSVTGAPKAKTVEIIKRVENYQRGYYTGVFGYFDGKTLDSAVMIRYIEKENEKYYYKSGGGITCMSEVEKEYKELKDKIYVPVY